MSLDCTESPSISHPTTNYDCAPTLPYTHPPLAYLSYELPCVCPCPFPECN